MLGEELDAERFVITSSGVFNGQSFKNGCDELDDVAIRIRPYPEGFLREAMGASLRQMIRQAVNSTNPRYRS